MGSRYEPAVPEAHSLAALAQTHAHPQGQPHPEALAERHRLQPAEAGAVSVHAASGGLDALDGVRVGVDGAYGERCRVRWL